MIPATLTEVTAALAPDALVDAFGVAVEVTLERTVIAGAVTDVVGGRVKQRRLAQALLQRPDVLRDGRSLAPRVVADLLIALRRAGATGISPPVCAGCGKRLDTFQRRGQDWYCAVCDRRPEPCSVCGAARPVNFRDRHGRLRCAQCPPANERDPIVAIVDIVAGIDPSLPADLVARAATTAARQRGQRHQIAWALQERPDLLTGGGADAPAPCVLRLIDLLADAGSLAIVRPACPHCRRLIGLHRRIDGQWLCRNCVAKTRARPCAGCGAVREPGARDEHGRPLCATCLIRQPANHENCTKCGRRRPVSVRTPDGPRCETCRPWRIATCGICGRTRPCLISKTTGQPWCRAGKQRWARCANCGQDRPVRGGRLDAPLCATCARPDPDFWRACPGCGEPGRIRTGGNVRCARCTMHRRLREVLGDGTGEIRPEARALHEALAATDRPATVESWLHRSAAPKIQISEDGTRIRLGREPIVLPAPLADLVRDLVHTRRGHATIGASLPSAWLFPGGQPGRPISAFQLGERLRQLGLNPAQSRSSALFQLATDLPAAMLARMLGIHIAVAVAWQRASAGDWTSYAAQISRRLTTQGEPPVHQQDHPAISAERAAEAEETIGRVTRWAARRPDVVGLLLVGSYARSAARPDSDIDLVLLTNDQARYADNAWAQELALGALTRVQSWGAVTERRFTTNSGLNVEINIGSPCWASISPVDPGTHRVVTDGARPLHDPTGVLAALLDACHHGRPPIGEV